ncbi:MAG: bifunctional DNA-formamidopyrimidine glycosylase/DNA-(apurinic or apyrimidinic site) lyase [Hyphomicrobiales bacterium]|nr:bifunctional DNA-formamidopyrimidine glycosylase/DNA-(apurinic or apyrimidinic site) lyase [Hyphomicrobiales bacterium]
MPELPEVETTRRGLIPALERARIARVELRRKDLRFPFQPDFADRLAGRRVEKLERRAKYLVARLDSGDALVAHLGMSGSFRIEGGAPLAGLYYETARLAAHDHVLLHLEGGASVIYNDPRRFGFMFVERLEQLAAHPRFSGIGLEPLEPPLTGAALRKRIGASRAPLKAALLDQRLIAGLGNIYVCEALHRARLSPDRRGADLGKAEAATLARSIRAVLQEAIAAGGSTLRDFSGADGKPGYFQHRFRVYDREGAPCATRGCKGLVQRATHAGRSTFFCPSCQR